MKIVLVCNAGMSTSILAKKMSEEAQKKGIDLDISAHSQDALAGILESSKVDIVLVGPQIKYMYDTICKICEGKCPAAVIDMQDYGLVNGAAVLEKALKAIEENK